MLISCLIGIAPESIYSQESGQNFVASEAENNEYYELLSNSSGRILPGLTAMAPPRRKQTVHNQNQLQMAITNNGGLAYATYFWSELTRDPFSGEKIATVHYPRGSDVRFQLNATMLIGAIVNGDTLVSTGVAEIHGKEASLGDFRFKSIDNSNPKYDSTARSQMDIICEYLDTHRVFASADLRPHIPLGLDIKQTSMVWTGENIDDFILFEFEITNKSQNFLNDMYIGFSSHGAVNYTGEFDHTLFRTDDVTGFIGDTRILNKCFNKEVFNIAYSMDADGDPTNNAWTKFSTRDVLGIRFIDLPSDNWRVNYNWSTELGFRGPRFSPQRKPTIGNPLYTDLPHLMLGLRDVEAYYYLSHPEIDYNQLWTAVNQEGNGWLPPPAMADRHAIAARPYYLISAGPFKLRPGEKQSVVMAIVGGMGVHVNPWDFDRFYSHRDPGPFYQTLDFKEFLTNARWAEWIYDNPGVDTDDDGYAGEFEVCKEETTWVKGDGVPDYRADGPPATPHVVVTPSERKLKIQWNGFYTETKRDIFTNLLDFEGYNVYAGLDERRSSLTLLTGYDRENFNRFRWVVQPDGEPLWVNEGFPFTIDSLRKMFFDPDFKPLRYTPSNPQRVGDSLFYYAPNGFNASSLCCDGSIKKVYPNAKDPGTDRSKWTEDDVTYIHGEALPKFYEYEFTYDSLLATIPYWVAVTAYDFGFAGGNIPSKETDPLNNIIMEFAQIPADTVEKYDLDAYVYPNPWRADGNYAQLGYENRDGTEFKDRSHRVHFTNLPKVCKISIYSLDGDLVRTIDHNFPEGGPGAMHDSWDLITRNRQLSVSGLYYWVVESEDRTQLGKLVLIM